MPDQRGFWGATWSLVKPYWSSEERRTAWALLAAVVGITLAMVYVTVQFNGWYNAFYDALQDRNEARAFHELARFCALAAIYIGLAVYAAYLNQTLQLRWRRWMTARYLRDWLADRTYYHLQLAGNRTDNPDQRISEDLRMLVDGTLAFGLGLLNATVTLASFAAILWRVSGGLSIPYPGGHLRVPGYMLWVALLYAVAGTWLTHLLGRPLIGLNFAQQRYEADFRFGLVRFRENAERVALLDGERQELESFDGRFRSVLDNWWRIIKRQKTLNFFTVGYDQAAVVFPFLIALPRFFSGAIQLGGLVQISNAFGQVESSLSWFVGAYTQFATWRATADRLVGFGAAMRGARRGVEERRGIVIEEARDGELALEHLALALPDGRPLLADLDLSIRAGESLLLRGPSGAGKSTLFRAIAGIWPFGSGTIRRPRDFRPMFLPQTPYLPLGSLREVVSYPSSPLRFQSDRIAEALRACALPGLLARLDDVRQWALELSPGEQQRVVLARALLHRPAWLFLDEATSALDADLERRVYSVLHDGIPGAAIVSIGHRRGLVDQHARAFDLGAPGGALGSSRRGASEGGMRAH